MSESGSMTCRDRSRSLWLLDRLLPAEVRPRVLLLDAYGPPTHAQARAANRASFAWATARTKFIPLVLHALPLWKELSRKTDVRAFFNPPAFFGSRTIRKPYALASMRMMQDAGAKFEKLGPDECAAAFSRFSSRTARGDLRPNSGVLMARRAVQAVVTQAQKIGVSYISEAPLRLGRRRLSEVKTASGQTLSANTFVFACGPWLPKIFP